ncbi:MAG TPA: TonB-dependent receptor [Candidatus Dormibacteraeota bacterium]|nr:TonB-dependent receptor [Candidatus Dormibacteraeota bacterium]
MRIARSTLIGTAVAMALFGRDAVVHAQTSGDQSANQNNLEEVVVTGIRASLELSLEEKRAADSVQDIITSEDIGKMPDKNIADSLQRVPGLTTSSAGATEGGFDENDRVSMRGTNPSLTQTLINGHNVAAGDWFVLNQTGTVGRSVSYTLLPSEIVSQVVVHKSSEASLVEGGVAGSVDIITRKPLDFKRPFTFEASAGAVYADLPSKTDPQLSALLNFKNPDANFGVLLQGFYERRHLQRDGVELLGYDTIGRCSQMVTGIAGSTTAPGGGCTSGPVTLTPHPNLANVVYPTDIGAAFFTQERKRTGGLVDVQLKPNDNLSFDLNGFYSNLDAPNYNRNFLLWDTHYIASGAGQAPNPGYVVQNGTLVSANFAPVAGTFYGVYDQISRPNESESTNFIDLDTNLRVNEALSFFAQLGTSKGQGKTPTQDVSETLPDQGLGAAYQLNGVGSGPNFNFGSNNNTTPFPNGTPVAFGWIFGAQNVVVNDKEEWAKLDGTFNMNSGTWRDLKFGARWQSHDRTSFGAIGQGPTFSGVNGGGTSPLNYPQTFLNYPSDFESFGGNIPSGMWYWTPAQLAAYNSPNNVQRDPITRVYIPDGWFALHEKNAAAYMQADFKGDGWGGNFGLRYVHTGENVLAFAQDGSVLATTPGAVTTSAFGPYVARPVDHSYNDVLPSANLKLDLTKDLVARFAAAETMTRADYSAIAAPVTFGAPPQGATPGAANSGNPDLKPIRSSNLDAGLEWYFAKRSLLAATLFYMDLHNYIAFASKPLTSLQFGPGLPYTGSFANYDVSYPINAQGRVTGIEIAYQQALTEHWGIAGNYTYADGKQTSAVVNGDDRLVGTSKNTYNVNGYYEDAHFSARVAWNYRSAFFDGLDRSTAFSQDAIGYLSASLGYAFTDNFTVTLDGQNLNNPTLKYYALNTTQPRAFYVNGRQFYLSLRAKF